MSLLSVGGSPPFLVFPPKWLVIQAIFTNELTQVAAILVTTSQVTLYCYLKASYSQIIRVKKSKILGFLIIKPTSSSSFRRNSPQWARASSFLRFLDHNQRRTTVGRTPLDEWPAHRRDLYLTTHNTHNRQTSTPPGGIRTHNLRQRAAADPRLRPRGHWDLQCKF